MSWRDRVGHIYDVLAFPFEWLRKRKWRYAVYIPAFLLLLNILFFIFSYKGSQYDDYSVTYSFRSYGAMVGFYGVLIAFVSCIALWWAFAIIGKRFKWDNVAWGIVLISVAVLILFSNLRGMNYTWYKHDYWYGTSSGARMTLGDPNSSPRGHFGIIYDIYNNGVWPDAKTYNQTYQPKIWHSLMAAWMRIMSLFIKEPADNPQVFSGLCAQNFPLYTVYEYNLLETCRILICFYGGLGIFAAYKCFKAFFSDDRKAAIAIFLFAIVPSVYYIQFYGNNDGLAFSLMLLALWFALRYWKSHAMTDIILTAVFIGLGMSVKLSAAVVAVPTAIVFLLRLIDVYKNKQENKGDVRRFWIEIAVFAVIVFPLALWDHVYAYVKDGIPFGYVMDLEPNVVEEDQSTWNGMHISNIDHNAFFRFFLFPTEDLFYGRFSLRYWQNGPQDFNIWTAFLKTALFGESSYAFPNEAVDVLVSVAYYLFIILGLLFVIACFAETAYFVYRIVRERFVDPVYIFLAAIFLTGWLSYAVFARKYSVGCSMNCRYAMLLLIPIDGGIASLFIDPFIFAKSIKAQKASPDESAAQ
jgi:hypothetical protein